MKTCSSWAASLLLAATSLSSFAAEWTSLQVGTVAGYAHTHAHLSDGRMVLGTDNQLLVQQTFALPTLQSHPTSGVTFDPSFIVFKDDATGLLGGGGFGSSGVYPFDSSLSAPVGSALATLQNYNAVYWRHPSSGRSGWIIGGTNGTSYSGVFGPSQMHTLTFISDTGTTTGALTTDLCTYSAGIAVDAGGNLFVGISEPVGGVDEAEDNKVYKFTAAQVDAAVAGILASSPAPLAKASATYVNTFPAAGSLAVDSQGRVWASGYQIDQIAAHDPTSGVSRLFKPDHAKLTGANGPNLYELKTFTRSSVPYVSFLVADQFNSGGTPIVYGYQTETAIGALRNVTFSATSQNVTESAGIVGATIVMNPAPTLPVTIPISTSGTAIKGKEFSGGATSVTFQPGETSKSIAYTIINDGKDEPINTHTLNITLGTPTPNLHCGLGLSATTHTININDDDFAPVVSPSQTFPAFRVGSFASYTLTMTGGSPSRLKQKGLPKGLTLNPLNGVISGTPEIPGEYSVVITATNSAGTSTSVAFVITVADFPETTRGSFVALASRTGPGTGGLGARVDLTVSSTAGFTGKVTVGKKTYPISGKLNTIPSNPTGSDSFIHEGTPVDFSFTIDSTTSVLSGAFNVISVGGGGVNGTRALPSNHREGTHHFAIAASTGANKPEGNGWGIIKVSNRGVATISGKTADGSPFSSTSPVSKDGQIIIYQSLYSVAGSLLGRLTIAAGTDRVVSGTIDWSKPPQSSGELYRSGWSPELILAASGGKYRPVAGSTAVLSAQSNGTGTSTLKLENGGIDSLGTNPTVQNLTISAPAKVAIATPHKLSINPATGAISGSLKVGSTVLPFWGLAVPLPGDTNPFDGIGIGYFKLGSRTGSILIEVTPP